tara:strand:- start:871 stop:2316 length:1446 start_codon:yes stop_codon:yes gene_type:complete
MFVLNIFNLVFFVSSFVLSLYGLNMLILTLLFLISDRNNQDVDVPLEWPKVTVQLPLFNELSVVARLIESVVKLDYPRQCITIQILDDSNDSTTDVVRDLVRLYQQQGISIECYHRSHRLGNKAGALAAGLLASKDEFIAIFDADFVPNPDYLKKVIPYFNIKDVGMVQTRWGHLNPFHNLLTRAQTIALDGHLVVEQVARSRNDLLFNFNGSAGVWRKKCIVDSGGWQSDTIAEDLDLSYRAQIRGWDFRYLFDIVSPAEIPSELISFKSQQFRWVKGSVQCLCKHLLNIIRHSKFSFWQRYQAIMHLGGYLMHPMMLCFLISTVPYMLYADTDKLLPTWLGFAGFGPPLLYAVAQISAYRDGLSRFVWFPVLMVLGLGVAVNNTKAVIEALFGYKSDDFVRTPKSSYVSNEDNEFYANSNYLLVFLEILFGIYAFVSLFISISKFPSMSPFLAFFFIGFLLVAIFSYLETSRLLKNVKE